MVIFLCIPFTNQKSTFFFWEWGHPSHPSPRTLCWTLLPHHRGSPFLVGTHLMENLLQKKIEHLFIVYTPSPNLLALRWRKQNCQSLFVMNLLLLSEPKISPFAQAVVDLTHSRLGPQRRQPPFSRARKVMGLFSFTIGCSFFFTWKARIFPVKVLHKNMGTWLECIYHVLYMYV